MRLLFHGQKQRVDHKVLILFRRKRTVSQNKYLPAGSVICGNASYIMKSEIIPDDEQKRRE